MDKSEVIRALIEKIEHTRHTLTQAALAAHSAATHPESLAEDKYDTRGLEASYLAGAQSKRAMEMQNLANLYRFVDMKSFNAETPIASTALVELDHDGTREHYLLMPEGGGLSVDFGGKRIRVITPASPLGAALLNRKVGEWVEVPLQGGLRELEIVSIL